MDNIIHETLIIQNIWSWENEVLRRGDEHFENALEPVYVCNQMNSSLTRLSSKILFINLSEFLFKSYMPGVAKLRFPATQLVCKIIPSKSNKTNLMTVELHFRNSKYF